MRARIVLLLILLTGLWGLMLARAAYLQLWPDGRLKALQKRQFETVVTLNPRRGDVLDRNGHELAVSVTTYSLFADPKLIEEPRKVAKLLAHVLKSAPAPIAEKLRAKKRRFVWIERQLSKDVRDQINEMKIHGLGFIEESQRIYPNDRLLSHVLGFVGEDGKGLEGLELRYNEQLRAESKKVAMRRDARGRPLIVNGQVFNEAPTGADVQLTIDRELQFVLEQELAQAVVAHKADSAVGVVLDAQTSEILAMASSPSFDPNHHGDYLTALKRNRAVTDSFEPGSTMKTFVIAGALARGVIEPNSKFDCEGGVLRIGKRTIREADAHHNFGVLTTSEILALSSNVGASKIAFKFGGENVRETLKAFGFGEKTGVDLPGEAKGIFQPMPWKDLTLATVSFGHGMTATALQIANAYASIANGGYLKQPYVVKSVRDHENDEVSEAKPKVIRRVLNDEQVAKMRIMLAGATSDYGTGANARVPGFPVAGKTGTAQKVNPNGRGYLKGGYVSSFAGFLPANDPRFVIYVAVDHPKKEYYGAAVAAPVFSRIAKFAVRHGGLAPVLIAEENVVPRAKRVGRDKRELPRAIGDVGPADVAPESLDLAVQPAITIGEADAAGASVSSTQTGTVPDLTGLTLREVMGRISGTGVSLHVHGHGFVTHTSPPIGARLSESKDLNVYLAQ